MRVMVRRVMVRAALAVAVIALTDAARSVAAPAAAPTRASSTAPAAGDAAAWRRVWSRAGHRLTPESKEAWLQSARARAVAELESHDTTLPADFLAWVDGDPVVRATVYGVRDDAVNVLRMLRSLEIDLGKEAVRGKYTQLALALAVVHAAKGPEADLSDREPLKLSIPGDPREPVDTKDRSRPLDRNDHIINFLDSITIEEEVVVGHKLGGDAGETPPLRYDERGIALPPPKKAKPTKVPVTERRKRTLHAADVLASRELQRKFNDYMKAHGEDVSIDCGDQVVHWKSTAAVRGERKAINEAFVMFRTAYEEKGLLPKARDAAPSPAESAAWWIRNDSFRFPPETAASRDWPRYPLDAPWPTLTLLAADSQPLREREERWLAFRDKGEMRTYGEYIGPIAQQFDMQSARRITPYPFAYGTYQMMAKDGGVCGTMANMGVRTYNTLGIPACTAGQPGHCALIFFARDRKTGLYECKGGQFATGGPDKTSPHTPFPFDDRDARRPMVWYQTVAWAVNYGLPSYLDSMLALRMFRDLPQAEQAGHGVELLESGLALNPFNITLAIAAQDACDSPEAQIRFWKRFDGLVSAVKRPGCPPDGLYRETIRGNLFARLEKLPVPKDRTGAAAVLAFLDEQRCPNAAAVATYKVALRGIEAVADEVAEALPAHLASARTEASCRLMAGLISATADRMADKQARQQWLARLWTEMQGHGTYLGPKDKILTDDTAQVLAKLNRAKLAPETERLEPVLRAFGADFRGHVAGARDAKSCKEFAARIGNVAKQIKDSAQLRRWLEELARTIAGREQYVAKNKKRQDDPSAQVIQKLLASHPAAASS